MVPLLEMEKDMSITLIVGFEVKPEKLAAFTEILEVARRNLPGTGGCQSIHTLANMEDPTQISLIEVWESKDAHQAYIKALADSGDWQHIESHLIRAPTSTYYMGA